MTKYSFGHLGALGVPEGDVLLCSVVQCCICVGGGASEGPPSGRGCIEVNEMGVGWVVPCVSFICLGVVRTLGSGGLA